MANIRDATLRTEIPDLPRILRDMSRMEPELKKNLQKINKGMVQGVATEARQNFYPTVAAVGGTRGTPDPRPSRPSGRGSIGATRRSIRARATQRDARIMLGGPKAPGALGHEFGGGGPRSRQFPAWKGNDEDAGYVLYPTVRAHVDDAEKQWMEAVDAAFAARGLGIKG